MDAPLFTGRTQPTVSEVIAEWPLHSGVEAPVFPTWMRKPIPDEASTGAAPQINAEGSGRDESPSTSNSYAGAGEVNMSTPSPLAAPNRAVSRSRVSRISRSDGMKTRTSPRPPSASRRSTAVTAPSV